MQTHSDDVLISLNGPFVCCRIFVSFATEKTIMLNERSTSERALSIQEHRAERQSERRQEYLERRRLRSAPPKTIPTTIIVQSKKKSASKGEKVVQVRVNVNFIVPPTIKVERFYNKGNDRYETRKSVVYIPDTA